MRKIQYTLLILFTLTKVSVAQELSNVNIVADGSAPTKEKALTNALRNAIEKAFGAFISSSTKIENETLLYDQIASVAKGSIVSYDKIGEMRNASSQEWTTTISALVSPGKIIAFAQSKGIEVAFKGSVFAQNVLIEKYYKEQEPIILNHFIQSIDFKKIYNYTLIVEGPELHNDNRALSKYEAPFKPNKKDFTERYNAIPVVSYRRYLHVKEGLAIHNFNDDWLEIRNPIESYGGTYFIPIRLKLEKTPYFDQVMYQYIQLVSKIAITTEKHHSDETSGFEVVNDYESKYGKTFTPVDSELITSKENYFQYRINPAFRNPKSALLIEGLKLKFQRAYEGVIILPFLKSNMSKLNDYYFLTLTERNKYNWKSYLDEYEDESAIILYNVGTLDDLQKITSIKLNLE